jgi:uncharacterized damage-inducible protein DinB
MNKIDIEQLFEYNRWANARVLAAVSQLSPDQFTKDLSNSFPSVRDTLVHMVWAEWIWLMRWRGESPKIRFDPADFPTMARLKERWAEIEAGQVELINTLTEESLTKVIAYINTKGEEWKYPMGHMMQHVVNHASYHRGQIITMLRQLGAEAVGTDFLLFFDEK